MELEHEDAGKRHDVVLRFSRRPRRAEIPLLARDLAEARAVGGPAQREFLPPLVLRFLELDADALQELRLVEAEPQRPGAGCGPPPSRSRGPCAAPPRPDAPGPLSSPPRAPVARDRATRARSQRNAPTYPEKRFYAWRPYRCSPGGLRRVAYRDWLRHSGRRATEGVDAIDVPGPLCDVEKGVLTRTGSSPRVAAAPPRQAPASL